MDMREQKFGIEIEMTGLSRKKAADIIARHFGTDASYIGGTYMAYEVRDRTGRKWKLMYDSSITPYARQGYGNDSSSDYKVEFVSPICDYEDIGDIQEMVRQLRHGGAVANDSCGVHVHINAAPHNAQTLRNITNIIASKEDMIYKALQVNRDREEHYCQKVDDRFLKEINSKKPRTLDEVKNIWYRGDDGSRQHYHHSRYHCLNLHSVFQKGTVEFRLFNGTTHAGKIKAYIQFSLAISHQALTQRSASSTKTRSTNEKYTFRTWLLRMGMIGDEFKTARKFLLENLEGGIAWKEPEQAERQRERLRAQREEQSPEPQEPEESQEEWQSMSM